MQSQQVDAILMSNFVSRTVDLCTGLDNTRFTWNYFMKASAGRWKALALDQRGWGQSPLGNEDEYTAAAVVDDIEYALQHEFDEHQPVVLVGHGMGGKVAMKFACLLYTSPSPRDS